MPHIIRRVCKNRDKMIFQTRNYNNKILYGVFYDVHMFNVLICLKIWKSLFN